MDDTTREYLRSKIAEYNAELERKKADMYALQGAVQALTIALDELDGLTAKESTDESKDAE
jgi:hypothetical protein